MPRPLRLWADRGTGYNYFDGNSWEPQPNSRLESSRGGWPSIIAMGSGKEASINKHNMIIYTLTDLYYKYKNMIRSPLFNFTKNFIISFVVIIVSKTAVGSG